MKCLNWINKNLEEFLMVGLLVVMVIIMSVQVCSRYIFNNSLTWTEEITRYLFIWSGFISISFCIKLGISIKIEALASLLSWKLSHILRVITGILQLTFFIYLIPFAWRYLQRSIEGGFRSPACGIPMYFIQAAPLVAFSLSAVRLIQRILGEIKQKKEGEG